MKLYKLKTNEVEEIESESFKLEKDIQNLIENNTSEIFGLTLINSEFSIEGFRIDSLCFDEETNSFVIIEYKKGSSYSVVDQGYSYLSTMLNNKSEFILEYNESQKKSLKRNEINWSESRIVFISPTFNSYQKNSVNFKDLPFELYEIKKYKNDTISLNQILSKSKESIKNISSGNNQIIEKVNKEVKRFSEDDFIQFIQDYGVRENYLKLRDKILELENVEMKTRHIYVNFWVKNQVIIYFNKGRKKIMVEMLLNDKNGFKLEDPRNYFEIYEGKGGRKSHWYNITKDTDVDYLLFLIKQKYDDLRKKS